MTAEGDRSKTLHLAQSALSHQFRRLVEELGTPLVERTSRREGIAADMLRLLGADELDAAFCLLGGEIPDAFAVERLTDEEVVAAFAPDRAPPAAHVTVADAGDGFATAILPRSLTALVGPAVDVRSLEPAVHLPVALVWRRERNLSPAARACIEFVRRETAKGDGRREWNTPAPGRGPRILGLPLPDASRKVRRPARSPADRT